MRCGFPAKSHEKQKIEQLAEFSKGVGYKEDTNSRNYSHKHSPLILLPRKPKTKEKNRRQFNGST